MLLWHASPYSNLGSIIKNGLITNLGYIFFADRLESAALFVYMKGEKHIVVFPVEFTEEEVEESFDHNIDFFECRCFYVTKNIPYSRIIQKDIMVYNL